MSLDDLARRAAERARRAASAIAADMDPHRYRRRSLRGNRLTAAAAVGTAAVVVVAVAIVVGPEPEDRAALTTTTLPGTTTVTVPAGPAPDPRDTAPSPMLGAGWEELDAGPIAGRHRVAAAWTGSELFAWGGHDRQMQDSPPPAAYHQDGFLYDPANGSWRPVAPLPEGVCRPLGESVAMAVGDAIVLRGQPTVRSGCVPSAVYYPASDTWEPLQGEFLGRPNYLASVVWTGELLVAPTIGTAYDWASGETVALPSFPSGADELVHSPQRGHWTGDRVLSIGSGSLREWVPGDDAWRILDDAPVPERARDSVWTDQGLLVVNYDMAAAFYGDGGWTRPGDLPLRFFECLVEALSIGGTPVVRTCSGLALWDAVRAAWIPAPLADLASSWWSPLVVGTQDLYSVGPRLLRFSVDRAPDGSIVAPPTMPMGVMQLDVPDGFAFVSSFAPEQDPAGFIGNDSTIGAVFEADGGRRCVVSSEYRGGELITEETFGTVVVVRPGRSPIEAVILGAPANGVRLAVEASTSDVVTVFCEAPQSGDGGVAEADGRAFLAGLWSPWDEG